MADSQVPGRDFAPPGTRAFAPAAEQPETGGPEHPPRPLPSEPPADVGLRRWAEQLNLAAGAWAPELGWLIDRLEISPGARVLDAGCGPGRITGWLAERVRPGGLVNGVDPDVGALEYAAWWLGQLELPGINVELGASAVEALPFASASFDAAWCSGVLAYVADPLAALHELTRVVRRGGRVIVVSGDAGRATWLPVDADLELAIRRAELAIHDSGQWGSANVHVGRRLYALAAALPVARVEPVTVVWERTAPLTTEESAYLHATHGWLADAEARAWLGDDWERCWALFDPGADGCVLQRPDLHVVQTTSAVVITV